MYIFFTRSCVVYYYLFLLDSKKNERLFAFFLHFVPLFFSLSPNFFLKMYFSINPVFIGIVSLLCFILKKNFQKK
jgi:hypothetical protein